MDWPTTLLALTIPVLLRQGSIVIADLRDAVKAKKALEDQVFRLARDNPEAREALAASPEGEARMAVLTHLALESDASLDWTDATIARRGLKSRAGRADYARDVARHVEAKLSAKAA